MGRRVHYPAGSAQRRQLGIHTAGITPARHGGMKMDAVSKMLQVGVVSSVDAVRRRVRVLLPETGMVSGWLFAVGTRRNSVPDDLPEINDRVLVCYLPVEDGDGFVLGVIG